MEIRRCLNCMEELAETTQCCPACGADNGKIEQLAYALKCGSILHERYLIGRVLGQGGFGITYIGMDLLLNVKVAIKEYFPMGLVARDPADSSKLLWNPSQASQSQRQGGYNSFLKEARKMAKIARIPSIVRVLDIFLDNETAYIVMDYVEGITLKQKLSQDGPVSFSECIALLHPMMEDLEKVHKEGMIHRDISPDNIMIQPDGSVRLLDLGAAKDMTAVQGVSSQVVAKKGFSPFEQYQSGGEIGPWTDVYALCTTIYYCITGKLLPDAFDRVDKEEINFPDSLKEALPQEAREALRAGLEVRPKKRTQSVEELLWQLDAGKMGEEVAEGTRQEGKEEECKVEEDLTPRKEEDSALKQEGEGQEAIADLGQNEGIEQISADKGGSLSKTPKVKKGVWAALAVCLVLVAGVFTKIVLEPKGLPVMMEDNNGIEDKGNGTVLGSNLRRGQICSITFQDNLKNQPEDAWDVSEKQDGTVMAWISPAENDMYELYIGGKGGVQAPKSCRFLFNCYTNVEEINFNGCFDTSQVMDMRFIFSECKTLKHLDISSFDTSCVTDMRFMFSKCVELGHLDVSNFETSKVTNMSSMFSGCISMKRLDLGSFDTSQVTDMKEMFGKCESLGQLDVSNFETSKVTNMSSMFSGCKSIKGLDLGNFDTSQVTDMKEMFWMCESLEQLNVSSFDTSQVTDMKEMFGWCDSLEQLNVSSFNTSRVTSMEYMFNGCKSLSQLDLSNFDISNVSDKKYMFKNCPAEVTGL